jgi:hypothetical protein
MKAWELAQFAHVQEILDFLRANSRSSHPASRDVDAECAAADMTPKINAEDILHTALQGGVNVVNSLECWVCPFNHLYGFVSEVKIGDEVVDCTAGGFLAVELRHGLPMAFRVQRLKTLRSNHPDHMLVGKPSDLPVTGKFGGSRQTTGARSVTVSRLMAWRKIERSDVDDAGPNDRLRVSVMPPRVWFSGCLDVVLDLAKHCFGGFSGSIKRLGVKKLVGDIQLQRHCESLRGDVCSRYSGLPVLTTGFTFCFLHP